MSETVKPSVGGWLRHLVGMETPEEREALGEKPKVSKRKAAIDKMIDSAEAAEPDTQRTGANAGELGKKWDETFQK